MKNWINFFRDKKVTDIPSSELEKLYIYVEKLSSSIPTNINDFIFESKIKFKTFKAILPILQEYNLIEIKNECPECQKELSNSTESKIFRLEKEIYTCPECQEEIAIRKLNFIQFKENISEEERKNLLDDSYEINARLLESTGLEQKHLFYLVSDIEGSHVLQRENEYRYTQLLKDLWENIWMPIFRLAHKPYLPLMARGDAVVIAFSSIEDIIKIITKLKEMLKKNNDIKLSIAIDKITFDKNDGRYMMRGLDGKWDMNSREITDLYRKFTAVKPKIWEEKSNYMIKYIVFDRAASLIESYKDKFENIEQEKYNFSDKHNKGYSGSCLAGTI